ncbi:MAG TPA: tetratricopeptide repeat protein [Chthonomonadaceae bacterium]|nr:tetratricopeptide repeat protein [Chthonomonadaceae bacterium]
MREWPGGIVTFVFTDIEGSTRLWEQHPAAMRDALARHDDLLRQVIEANGGCVFETIGDAFRAAFASAQEALTAALEAQRALHGEPWGATGPLRVRVVLHTGPAEARNGDYFGPTLSRVDRLLDAGYGGQILLSQATQEQVCDGLPNGVSLRDLGEHRLKDLVRPERVFQLIAPDLPADFPPLRSLDQLPNNLPRQLSSFIGREREISEIKRQLTQGAGTLPLHKSGRDPDFENGVRLLTLTGCGGCGKTRLAIQAAADLLEAYPDGVWLVELAALSDPAQVPRMTALALGIREEPGRLLLGTLTEALAPRRLLLILDNCEHLIAACAALANTLLRACPRLQIVTTSREALGIAGETAWRVPPLAMPDPRRPPTLESLKQCDAVRLFSERAVAVHPDFCLTDHNAATVLQICHRLDGIPLAIELAAARVRVLPVEQIAARLDDRFRLLTGGSRAALPRHQTLQAMMDWSYDLLSEMERVLFRRLSVFVGGFPLEAVEAICSAPVPPSMPTLEKEGTLPLKVPLSQEPLAGELETLTLLLQLVDKSLVMVEGQESETRYRLLETVRRYGQDKLEESGEAPDVRGRHRDWYLQLAEQSERLLYGAEQEVWLGHLEREQENLRAALAWCKAAQDVAAELRLSGALCRFWSMRGDFSEGRELLMDALARAEQGEAPDFLMAERAKALHGAGVLAWWQGDYGTANGLLMESLHLYRALEDASGVAYALIGLGRTAQCLGEPERAAALYEEALALLREKRDQPGIALALTNLAAGARERDDYAQARQLEEESLALRREMADRWGIAHSRNNLGRLARLEGQYERASALHKESLAQFCALGAKLGIAESLEGLAGVASARGDFARAAPLWGAAEALREALRAPLLPFARGAYHHEVATARSALGEEAFAEARAQGHVMPLEQAVAFALEG